MVDVVVGVCGTVEVVVDEQGTSVVELVGPVPVVDVIVVLGASVVVVPGATVVVVAAVVVVVPGGTPAHPNELATDAKIAFAPGKPPNTTCSDWSNRQIGSRKEVSSWATTWPCPTGEDPAAGMPRRSATHNIRPNRLRRRLAKIAVPPLEFNPPSRTRWERRTVYCLPRARLLHTRLTGGIWPKTVREPRPRRLR